ncbi:MAG: PTS lactose/cellobiose transporter subunit IIA [Symbiopectobacterium sp.]|uniref:PTS lactose/cellobiose transporter subunit IIA n=1 Tax=Symbiopectobacterium sp. TaxID=2952789 RepID=UPI0039E733FF
MVEAMVEAEEAAMEIIVNADESRSLCLEALQAARYGQVEQANALMTRADRFARLAHQVQTQLVARETVMPMTSIMAHAQDYLITSLLVRELANEMLYLYQR